MLEKVNSCQAWWLKPIILAILEAEIRRIMYVLRQKVHKTQSVAGCGGMYWSFTNTRGMVQAIPGIK
jgi:hypothetical protein